ncbi:MAG: hypothetical protein KAU01_10745 [Candidatus Cloacimonetes bacterium]|nr:hypothetical protein [Candidatus Cloacimonadota bacterium]
MKKQIVVFFVIYLFSFSLFSQNLILNPGCEEPLISGEILDWQEIVGSNWTRRGGDPIPYEGGWYFFAGECNYGHLRQDVDVSYYSEAIDNNLQYFYFEGYVRSYNQSPEDDSRIVLEYLNFDTTIVLTTFDSGLYNNTTTWIQVTDNRLAPPDTRYIRINLHSYRNYGTNNDGYFDALLLQAVNPEIPENISILINEDNVELTWDEVVGATSYSIYSSDDPYEIPENWTLEASGITDTNWSELVSEDKKFYYVTAVN